MSGAGLFVYGFIVTLLVCTASGLLVWGAILDGRYEKEMRALREREAAVRQRDGAERPASAGRRDEPVPVEAQ